MARLTDVLIHEHQELLALLHRCVSAAGALNLRLYDEFRLRQLRHLAVEEKVLLPMLRERGALPAAFHNGLRKDHEAVVVLCLTAPNPDFVRDLYELLAWHHKVEEEPGGVYQLFDQQVGDDPEVDRALARLPPVTLPPYATGDKVPGLLRQVMRELGVAGDEAPR